MPELATLVVALLVLAVLVWGGDGLIKLIPGNSSLKQAARIIAIVALALWVLSWLAGYFGIPMPWHVPVGRHR